MDADLQLEHSLTDAFCAESKQWEARRLAFKDDEFGHPFAPCKYTDEEGKIVEHKENNARYRLWPLIGHQLPLHYYLARTVLCAPATSTGNESLHSIAAYILNRYRQSMSPEKAAVYTILKKQLPQMMKAHASSFAAFSQLERAAEEDGFLDTEALDRLITADAVDEYDLPLNEEDRFNVPVPLAAAACAGAGSADAAFELVASSSVASSSDDEVVFSGSLGRRSGAGSEEDA
jgi:hypothetical protein